jgi:hypothetical protein
LVNGKRLTLKVVAAEKRRREERGRKGKKGEEGGRKGKKGTHTTGQHTTHEKKEYHSIGWASIV